MAAGRQRLDGAPREVDIDLTRPISTVAENGDPFAINDAQYPVRTVQSGVEQVIDLTDEPYVAGYFRTEAEVARIHQALIEASGVEDTPDGLVMMYVPGTHPWGDAGRTYERNLGWDGIPAWMHGYEHAAFYLFLIDATVPGGTKIIAGGAGLRPKLMGSHSTGSKVLDSLHGLVTPEEMSSHHGLGNPRDTMIEGGTMYRRPDVPESPQLPFGPMPAGYLSLLSFLQRERATHSLGFMNEKSLRSLDRLGFEPELLCGRRLSVPEEAVSGDEVGTEYLATVIRTEKMSRVLLDPSSAFQPVLEPYWALTIEQCVVE
jgi:hypothetical protein